jgi:hypothetical protein
MATEVDIFLSFDVFEVYRASGTDVERIACILVVLLHMKPEVRLSESGVIAVALRKPLQWK